MPNPRLIKALALGGALAPPSFVVAMIVASLLTPGYSNIQQTVSELAAPGVPHPEVLQAGFITYDALVLGLVVAVRAAFKGRRGGLLLPMLLVPYALGGIGAAVFRDDFTDVVAFGRTVDDFHNAFALATYAVILAATLVAAWAFWRDPAWRGFAWFSLAMALLTGGFGLAFELHDSVDFHGVYQRGFFVTTMAWVEVLSLRVFLGRWGEAS